MKMTFKDVSRGVVDARVIIEVCQGVYINEISVLRKDGKLQVEFPQKSFKGRDGRMHWMDIMTFRDDDKKNAFSDGNFGTAQNLASEEQKSFGV